MTFEEANEKAKEWLLANHYKQFKDGTWESGGYEADVQNVLAEYIEEREVSL